MLKEVDWSEWAGLDNDIAAVLEERNKVRKEFYPRDAEAFIGESNVVANAAEGDYKFRQLFELIQNATDAMTPGPDTPDGGRVAVVLTPNALYCANQGRPFSLKGFLALTHPYVSGKDDNHAIGQFGVGFRSVATISDNPEVVSKSCSVRYSRSQILKDWFSDNKQVTDELENKIINHLLYSIPVDPVKSYENEEVMKRLMGWATTIIKLPLDRSPQSSYQLLKKSMEEFPPEFLLFCRHLDVLEFEIQDTEVLAGKFWSFKRTGSIETKTISADEKIRCDRMNIPSSGGNGEHSEWVVFVDSEIPLDDLLNTDDDSGLSRARRRKMDGSYVPVTLSWAVNVLSPGAQRGRFWFHFPTDDEVSLKGIVNAPWDTNAGRTSLLSPETNGFNKILMARLSKLVVAAIPEIGGMTTNDIGRYLDLMPAQGDEETSAAARYFVPEFWRMAGTYDVIPDLDGTFCGPSTLRKWPAEIVASVVQSNSSVVSVAADWSSRSRDRKFPHMATFKNVNRNRRLNDFFNAIDQGMES
jgi:hypothetical protein